MGIFDRFGSGRTHPRGGVQQGDDERAVERYRYLLRSGSKRLVGAMGSSPPMLSTLIAATSFLSSASKLSCTSSR